MARAARSTRTLGSRSPAPSSSSGTRTREADPGKQGWVGRRAGPDRATQHHGGSPGQRRHRRQPDGEPALEVRLVRPDRRGLRSRLIRDIVKTNTVDFAARHFRPDPASEPHGLPALLAEAKGLRNYVYFSIDRGELRSGRSIWLGLDTGPKDRRRRTPTPPMAGRRSDRSRSYRDPIAPAQPAVPDGLRSGLRSLARPCHLRLPPCPRAGSARLHDRAWAC